MNRFNLNGTAKEFFGYEGKVAVVTGASSGMGKATAQMLIELGAEVYAMARREVKLEGLAKSIQVDLTDKAAIDDAFSQVPEKIDFFFGVAGLRGATLPFMTVAKTNLIANKYILEEVLIDRFNEGGAAAIVTSAAGISWEKDGNMKFFKAVVDAEGYEATVAALEATGLTAVNGGFAYVYTKLAANYLVARLQGIYGPKKIRVNALLPGETATEFGSEDAGAAIRSTELTAYAGYSGRAADAEEMAAPLVFLCSNMASYISGAMLSADYGLCAEIMGGQKANPCGESIEANFSRRR